MKCIYCSKEFTNAGGRGSHQKYCDLNPNKGVRPINRGARKNKGKEPWNKGKTGVQTAWNKGKTGLPGTPHTEEFKQKQSILAKNRNLGGVTQSRWITYKGKTLGSSYELRLVEDLDKHNIRWDTCKRFPYRDNTGKRRSYTPDIYLCDYNIYLDPKNDFLINNVNPRLGFSDKDKISWVSEQNNITVIILNKDQLSWESIKELIAPETFTG